MDKSYLNLNRPKGKQRKIAMLFKKNSHIKIIKDYLEKELIPNSEYSSLTVGVINGNTKDKIKEQEHDVILSTDSSFSKAVDIPDLEILINFVPVGSVERANQIFGRLRYVEGKTSLLIDVVDESVEALVAMADIRISKFYNQHAKNIKKLRGDTYGSEEKE
jgi:superfamily II DNA or RNA helicase